MEFRVVDRPSLDVSKWDRLVHKESFFQTVPWSDVCVKGFVAGKRAASARAVFLCGYEGDMLVAGLPAVIIRRVGFRSFYSMPGDTYGGVIYSDEITDDGKREFLDYLTGYLRSRRFSRVRLVDFHGRLADWSGFALRRSRAFTHVISLSNTEDFCPHKRVMRDLRTARREAAEIVSVSGDADVDAFYRLYRITELRHGRRRPIYTKGFFEVLAQVMRGSPSLYWTGLIAEGEMIASQVNFIHGGTLFNWRVVSDYSKRRHKPNQTLLLDAIQKGREGGASTINLGASPPEAEGLIGYKERWGGGRVDYDILTHWSGVRRLLGR
jgi:CelD/BcsL family acetyltransferase involved in cellulose biosynthesis